jgi:hypothetical protein
MYHALFGVIDWGITGAADVTTILTSAAEIFKLYWPFVLGLAGVGWGFKFVSKGKKVAK